MSYDSTGTEDWISIEPPLSTKECRDWPERKLVWPTDWKHRPAVAEISLLTTETTETLEDGDLIRRSGYAVATIEPHSEWSRTYTETQLQAVVDSYPDHEFVGYLEFLGEDGERWRYIVKDRKVIKITPELVWTS